MSYETHSERMRLFIADNANDVHTLFGYLRGLLDGTAYGSWAARTFVLEYDRYKREKAS